MEKRVETTPDWKEEGEGDLVRSAIVVLGSPATAPEVPLITLFLEVEEVEDDGLMESRWTFGEGEEEAGFGEFELESGTLPRFGGDRSRVL